SFLYTGPAYDMGARIVASAGPLRGAIFPLLVEEIWVGRDQTAGIFLEDRSASRRHCLIRREGAQFKVVDLESRNGTFVNGLPVTERRLEDGDEIRIGNSLFTFDASAGDEIPVSTCVTLQDERFAHGTTVVLQSEDAAEVSTRNL